MTENLVSLRRIIPVEHIPQNLGFMQGQAEEVLSKIFILRQRFLTSQTKEDTFFIGNLVFFTQLGFEIPGTSGTKILLNPGGDTNRTEVELSFRISLAIKRHIDRFNLRTFDFTPNSFFDLLLRIIDANERSLLDFVIGSFITDAHESDKENEDPDQIQQFVINFNDKHSPLTPLDISDESADPIGEILNQMKSGSNDYDIFEILLTDYILTDSLEESKKNIEILFSSFLGKFTMEDIIKIFIPQVSVSIRNINSALEFPRSILNPINEQTGEPYEDESIKSMLTFTVGTLEYSSEHGFNFINSGNFDFTKSEILNTGFTVEFTNAKIDLSRTSSIQEVTAVGYPPDFVGVFISEATIGLPSFLPEDSGYAGPQASIIGKNLIIGTGGFSGTLTLDDSGNQLGLKTGSQSGFSIALDQFSLTFRQNAIISSSIHGTLTIPGFNKEGSSDPAEINIDAFINTDGDFKITASKEQELTVIEVTDVFKISLNSLSLGRKDERYYIAVSGKLDFIADIAPLGKILPKAIDIKKLIVWEDGSIEFEGGGLILPDAVDIKIGPVQFSCTAIHMGTEERGTRMYRYIGFDGGININPGGVDVRGDGVKYYYTIDGGAFDHFIRIQSIAIDLILPGNASETDATLILNGYLTAKNPEPGTPAENEYMGAINFSLPRVGIGGNAGIRLNPDTPSFIVDAGVELANPIPLGTTGLGFYGFRGLFGRHYVPSKSAAGVSDDANWWQYYKAKVPPENTEGVTISKFSNENPGVNIGAGASIATTRDSGRAFSSKIFLLLGYGELFLLQGQAAVLSRRVGLGDDDPPFRAMLAITRKSVEAGVGASYQVPSSGSNKGRILDINGDLEMAFFFNNATGWYINFGKDTPEEKRIRARIFSLFNGYAYLMISAGLIRAGAGIQWRFEKKYGPVGVGVEAFMDAGGFISFRPAQIGGHITLGGSAYIRISRLRRYISVVAMLAAEAPKPFKIQGSFMLEMSLPRLIRRLAGGDLSIEVTLRWILDDSHDTSALPIIEAPNGQSPAAASHIPTGRNFPLAYNEGQSIPDPGSWSGFDDAWIPQDCYIDVDLSESVKPGSGLTNIGGNKLQTPVYTRNVPPKKSKESQVKHEFYIEEVNIKYRNGSSWQDYDVYKAVTPLIDNLNVNPNDLDDFKAGYWQLNEKNRYNKLRIMSQHVFEHITRAAAGRYSLDAVWQGGNSLWC